MVEAQAPWFSWYGNIIDGRPYPTTNYLRGTNPGKCSAKNNHRRHLQNVEKYGKGRSARKSFRRAVRLARGLMDDKMLLDLLKRVGA